MKQFKEMEELLSKKKTDAMPMDDKKAAAKEQVLEELIDMMRGIRSSRLDNEMHTMKGNPASQNPDKAANHAERTVDKMQALPEEGDAAEVAEESNKETTQQDKKVTGHNISEEEPMSFMEKRRRKKEKS